MTLGPVLHPAKGVQNEGGPAGVVFLKAILKIAPEVGNLPLGIRIVGLQPCLHQLHSLANHHRNALSYIQI